MDCATSFNRSGRFLSRAVAWTQRYPSRTAGWLYTLPAIAFAGSGVLKCTIGEVVSGGSLIALSLCDLFGCLALIRWGDPEISAEAAGRGFADAQDMSLLQRLRAPHKAPHEFAGALALASTSLMVVSAVADPTVSSVVMAVSCVFGALVSAAAERAADHFADRSRPATSFNQLADRGRQWVQARPLRAAFWMYAPCNVAQIVDGYLRPGGVDFWMMISGAAYMSINAVRARASKRVKVLPSDGPA